jgi:hypothetical protein
LLVFTPLQASRAERESCEEGEKSLFIHFRYESSRVLEKNIFCIFLDAKLHIYSAALSAMKSHKNVRVFKVFLALEINLFLYSHDYAVVSYGCFYSSFIEARDIFLATLSVNIDP